MIRDLQTLKSWFVTGAYPTQEQFWDWMDSFIHKTEGVQFQDIQGLTEYINERNQALLDEVNRVITEAADKLQLERRIALTMERTEQIVPIGEDMTLYFAKGRNVSKLEYKENDPDITDWAEIPLNEDTSIDLPDSDIILRIKRETIDSISTIYLFAKVKVL